MARKVLTRSDVLDALSASPRRIAHLTSGIPAAQLQTPPGPKEWSVNEVLAHLRSCADVGGAAIAAIVAEDGVTLKGVDPRTWIKKTDYPRLAFRQSFRAFSAQRDELLAILEPLPPAAWSRRAIVTGGGVSSEKTVSFYAEWLAGHEQRHLRQIAQIVGRRDDQILRGRTLVRR